MSKILSMTGLAEVTKIGSRVIRVTFTPHSRALVISGYPGYQALSISAKDTKKISDQLTKGSNCVMLLTDGKQKVAKLNKVKQIFSYGVPALNFDLSSDDYDSNGKFANSAANLENIPTQKQLKVAITFSVPTVKLLMTSKDLADARQLWGDALIDISTAYDTKGIPAAKEIAERVVDNAYGYNLGKVLFKPTLTSEEHTFRTTRAGAISYFIGQNPEFPDDGFALNGWRKVEYETKAEFTDDDIGGWMGIVTLTDKNGNKTKVDKSWNYKKGQDGNSRILLHHSSLTYNPT
jgi:hypothetical protein